MFKKHLFGHSIIIVGLMTIKIVLNDYFLTLKLPRRYSLGPQAALLCKPKGSVVASNAFSRCRCKKHSSKFDVSRSFVCIFAGARKRVHI